MYRDVGHVEGIRVHVRGIRYPVDRLGLLLGSENDWAVETGVWIASELGVDAAPLLDDLRVLLQHPSAAVRFYAADSIYGSAGDDRGDVIAEAIKLIDDPDRGVRWKVMGQPGP